MSGRGSRTAILVLAGLGLAISAYLIYVHYADVKPFCTGLSDCVRVQSSEYSKWAGIPIALIGALGYLGILASLALRGDLGLLGGAFLAFVGAGFSLYLTWVEAVRIEAFCQWCLVSAALMVALAVLSARRLLQAA
jgi:uncharacterized membrane protein